MILESFKEVYGGIIVEYDAKNKISKLYLTPIADGRGCENRLFDFAKVHGRTISKNDIITFSVCDDKVEIWKISIKGIGTIQVHNSKVDNTIEVTFVASYLTAGNTFDIKVFIENDECVIHDNGRVWRYDVNNNYWAGDLVK